MAFGVGRHGTVIYMQHIHSTIFYLLLNIQLEVIHYLNGVAGNTLQKIAYSGIKIVIYVLFLEVSIDDLVKSCGMKLYVCRPMMSLLSAKFKIGHNQAATVFLQKVRLLH